jgi:hypothetical protein
LRRTQHGDHSSRSRIAPGLKQPTRGSERLALASETHTGWASPPLLFGLAPRGVFRAPGVATQAVGSYPTFSPLPNALDRNRRAPGFSESLPPRYKHHRRFIFCGTFRSRAAWMRFRSSQDATPWRYQARRPAVAGSCEFTTAGVRTFLPFVSFARDKPAITRLTRQSNYTMTRARLQSLRPIAIRMRFTYTRADCRSILGRLTNTSRDEN